MNELMAQPVQPLDHALVLAAVRAIKGCGKVPTVERVAAALEISKSKALELTSRLSRRHPQLMEPRKPYSAPSIGGLTPRQLEIYEFIAKRIRTNYAPTVREIGQQFGILSPNGVMCHLKALEKKGLIHRDSDTSRGITLVDSPDQPHCPACGRPLPPGTELSPTG